MSKNVIISVALFENFHGAENGGILCASGAIVKVSCCYFTENSCQQEGGCFYLNKTDLVLKKTSFYRCWAEAYKNDRFGNAFCQNENKALLENVNVVLCSYTNENNKCADSCIYFEYCLTTINKYNASDNCGWKGGAGFNLRYSEENSTVSYANVINGRDESMIQGGYKPYTVQKTNLINCTECAGIIIYQHSSNMIILRQCILWDTGEKQITNEDTILEVYETYADQSFGNIKQIEQCSTNLIIINMKCPLIYYEKLQSKEFLLPFLRNLITIFLIKKS